MTLPYTETPVPSPLVGGTGTTLGTGPSNPLQDAGSGLRPDEGSPVASRELGEDSRRTTAGGQVLGPMGQLLADRLDELRADREWSMHIYSLFARGGDDEHVSYLVFPGDPWSKSRPRFTKRGRTYQPRDDQKAEQRLREHLQEVRVEAFTGNVMLACRFYRSNYQRIDADNLLKHVCDSANGVWWKDDSQVTLVLGEVHHDREHPRTIILAGNHASTLPRGSDLFRPCDHCGKMFRPQPGRARMATQVHCSKRCSRVAAGFADLSDPVACPRCGESFRRKTSEQKYCSQPCARESSRGVPKGRSRVTRCPQCGKTMSHNRGGRCRDCWRTHPKGQPEPVQAELGVDE